MKKPTRGQLISRPQLWYAPDMSGLQIIYPDRTEEIWDGDAEWSVPDLSLSPAQELEYNLDNNWEFGGYL